VGDCIATARTLPCPGWAQQAVTWKSIGRTAGVALREIATPGRTKRGYRRGVIERGGRFLQSRELIRLATSDLYWDRILGIEPVGMRETYDLEIEDDHTFVANDIVVHNSHASSFALLAYASAYLKAHHAPAFYAALLNNQPMGFYHPATIVNDARRHGQRILPIDVTRSDWLCTVEDIGDGAFAVRLGLRYVKGLREEVAKALVAARAERPFASATEVALRVCLDRAERETLAAIGAFASLRGTRRQNVWTLAAPPVGPLFATVQSEHPPEAGNGAPAVVPHSPLPEMTEIERLEADYAGTRVTVGRHPMALRRVELARRGVTRAADLARGWPGQRIRVAGSVIVRQRPGTAKGFLFLSLEDETGIANVIVTPQHFERQRLVLVSEPFLLVEGVLQKQDGVVSIKAGRVQPLPPLTNNVASHDFG
jgi:error-prone DNA polymerase